MLTKLAIDLRTAIELRKSLENQGVKLTRGLEIGSRSDHEANAILIRKGAKIEELFHEAGHLEHFKKDPERFHEWVKLNKEYPDFNINRIKNRIGIEYEANKEARSLLQKYSPEQYLEKNISDYTDKATESLNTYKLNLARSNESPIADRTNANYVTNLDKATNETIMRGRTKDTLGENFILKKNLDVHPNAPQQAVELRKEYEQAGKDSEFLQAIRLGLKKPLRYKIQAEALKSISRKIEHRAKNYPELSALTQNIYGE